MGQVIFTPTIEVDLFQAFKQQSVFAGLSPPWDIGQSPRFFQHNISMQRELSIYLQAFHRPRDAGYLPKLFLFINFEASLFFYVSLSILLFTIFLAESFPFPPAIQAFHRGYRPASSFTFFSSTFEPDSSRFPHNGFHLASIIRFFQRCSAELFIC